MLTSRLPKLAGFSSLLLLAACFQAPHPAQPSPDAGGVPDAGPVTDAGPLLDAGFEPDAGEEPDAGAESDAGVIPDAGVPDAGPSLSAEAACADFDLAHCAFLRRCGSYESLQVCLDTSSSYLESGCSWDVAPGVRGGRLWVDPVKWPACLDAISHQIDCYGFAMHDIPPCAAALVGKGQPGDACYGWLECDSDTAYCDLTSTCPGICRALVEEGQAADAGFECRHGLYFNESTGTCEARIGPGGACTKYGTCIPGLVCNTAGICVAGASGDPCTHWADCAPYLSCQNGVCSYYKGLGESCPGAYCKTDLTCAMEQGSDAGTCVPRGSVGDPCLSDDTCLVFHRCIGSDADAGVPGTCQRLGTQGVPCSAHSHCDQDHYCEGSACAARKPMGAACTENRECEHNGCDAGVCASSHCLDYAP